MSRASHRSPITLSPFSQEPATGEVLERPDGHEFIPESVCVSSQGGVPKLLTFDSSDGGRCCPSGIPPNRP